MSPLPRYDVAADFRISLRAAVARQELPPGCVTTASCDGEILQVVVRLLPAGSFNPDFLCDGPAHGRHLLTARGLGYWDHLTQLAVEAALRAGPDCLAGLILHGEALESARDALPVAA